MVLTASFFSTWKYITRPRFFSSASQPIVIRTALSNEQICGFDLTWTNKKLREMTEWLTVGGAFLGVIAWLIVQSCHKRSVAACIHNVIKPIRIILLRWIKLARLKRNYFRYRKSTSESLKLLLAYWNFLTYYYVVILWCKSSKILLRNLNWNRFTTQIIVAYNFLPIHITAIPITHIASQYKPNLTFPFLIIIITRYLWLIFHNLVTRSASDLMTL